MNNFFLLALIQNASLLLAMAVLFDITVRRWKTEDRWWKHVILGFVLGLVGIVVMNIPFITENNLRIDTRSILLSVSGLFFGIIPTAVAVFMTSVYRITEGGAYITGIGLILVTSFIGLLWRWKYKNQLINLKWWQIYIFGIVVHLGMLANLVTQPASIAIPTLKLISFPVMLIYPIGTTLLGMLLVNRMRREVTNEEVQKSRSRLKSMVDILQNLGEDDQAFMRFVLEEAVKLMESELGFIFYFSEETNMFTLGSLSAKAIEACNIPQTQTVFELDKIGFWGEPVRQRKPIVINNFQTENSLKRGFPDGHPSVIRLLEIPVFVENKVVAVVGVANKADEYNDIDVDQLNLLMETVWKAIDRKKAIEQLRISEENYRQLFNQAVDGIFITTADGTYLDVNESGCAMLGYSLEELRTNFNEVLKNNDVTVDINKVISEVLSGRRVVHERQLKTKQGNLIDVEIFTQRLPDGRIQKVVRNITERKKADAEIEKSQNELQNLLKISDDSRKALLSVIEDQKEIEEALRKSEKSFRSLFENITQGFALHKMIFDADGSPIDYRFLAINPAYEKMTGLYANKILGKTVKEVLPEVESSWIKTYGDVAITGNPTHFEDFTAALGKYYDVTAFCPESGFFAVVISDITERKKYEMEIKNFNLVLENRVQERTAELENANRELESFSYSISHDLRAPLRSIHGFSQIILEEYSNDMNEDVLHYFDLIRKNATMMGNLVDDLLNFSRLGRQSLKKVIVNSDKIVEEIIDSIQDDIKKTNIQITKHDLPDCEADPSLLRQVFSNLLSNSIKFSRKQQKPAIEIGFVNQVVEDGLTHSYFYVKDNGVGFDMKFYDKLFGVFQRLHRAEDYEGTGVGLAIVERIVKKHGGNIWAESVVGEGTTFYFTLGEPTNGK